MELQTLPAEHGGHMSEELLISDCNCHVVRSGKVGESLSKLC